MSSTRAGRHHDCSDSSVSKCQEQNSGLLSADYSTLALMSSLLAPASGAPCGREIIKMAGKENFPNKEELWRGGEWCKIECKYYIPTDVNHRAVCVCIGGRVKGRGKEREKSTIFVKHLSVPVLDDTWNLFFVGFQFHESIQMMNLCSSPVGNLMTVRILESGLGPCESGFKGGRTF